LAIQAESERVKREAEAEVQKLKLQQ